MADPVVLLSTGDVVGPNSSTDGTMVLFDGTTGKKVKGNNAVVTAQGLALLDDADAASNRATIGLDQVNNTSDINKPVSTAQQTAIDARVLTSNLSTQAEAEAGTNNTKWMSPLRVFQAIAKVVIQATETVFGWAKIATQAQTDAGTDDTTIVTPKKLRFGFLISLGNNGYIVFPTWMLSVIFQWGLLSNTANATSTGTFTLAYPNSCFAVLLTGLQAGGNTQAYATLNSKSLSGFAWTAFFGVSGTAPVLGNSNGNVQGHYFSIGR